MTSIDYPPELDLVMAIQSPKMGEFSSSDKRVMLISALLRCYTGLSCLVLFGSAPGRNP
jgi:hypothetical protein